MKIKMITQTKLLDKMAEKMYAKYLPEEDRLETRKEIYMRLQEFFNDLYDIHKHME